MSPFVRRLGAGTSAVVVALTLAACGSDPAPEPTSTAAPTVTDVTDTEPHNDADVEFARMMIVHHRDALAMAELADSRTQNADVLALAERIAAAQEPEIDVMTAWLESWGEDVPAEGDMGHSMGHDGEMPGAMSDEDMGRLEAAQGEAFDEAFLTLMVAHHEGAIEMAHEHEAAGSAPAALTLSREIATAQAAEIEEMQALLGS
jgi:uncharacterized protein (DUF305 family)